MQNQKAKSLAVNEVSKMPWISWRMIWQSQMTLKKTQRKSFRKIQPLGLKIQKKAHKRCIRKISIKKKTLTSIARTRRPSSMQLMAYKMNKMA